MAISTKPMLSLIVKCLAILALLGSFIAFMRGQEESSKYQKLQQFGLVSLAEIQSKAREQTATRNSGIGRRSSGGTTHSEVLFVHVRFDPKSKVSFADFDSGKISLAELPAAPAKSQDEVATYGGVMRVSEDRFQRSEPGDRLAVAIVPWDTSPVAVDDIRSFSALNFYYWMGGLAILAVLLWLLARRIR